MQTQQTYKVIAALSIGMIFLLIFGFCRQMYGLYIEDHMMFNVWPSWLVVVYYILLIPLLFLAKRYVNLERKVPLSLSLNLFFILLIIRAVVVIVDSLHNEYVWSVEVLHYSDMTRLLFREVIPVVSSSLFVIIKCFLVYFGVQFLLPGKGNSIKLKMLGVVLLVQVMSWMVFETLGMSITSYAFDPELTDIYEKLYINLSYVRGFFNILISGAVFSAVVNLACSGGFRLSLSKQALSIIVKTIIATYVILLVLVSLFVDIDKDINKYYEHLSSLLLMFLFLSVLLMLAYCFREKEKIAKSFQYLCIMDAIMLVLTNNMMLKVILQESLLKDGGNLINDSNFITLGAIALMVVVFAVPFLVVYVKTIYQLLTASDGNLFSRLLAYCFVFMWVFIFLSLALQQVGVIEGYSVIGSVLRRMSYLLFVLVAYRLVSDSLLKKNSPKVTTV